MKGALIIIPAVLASAVVVPPTTIAIVENYNNSSHNYVGKVNIDLNGGKIEGHTENENIELEIVVGSTTFGDLPRPIWPEDPDNISFKYWLREGKKLNLTDKVIDNDSITAVYGPTEFHTFPVTLHAGDHGHYLVEGISQESITQEFNSTWTYGQLPKPIVDPHWQFSCWVDANNNPIPEEQPIKKDDIAFAHYEIADITVYMDITPGKFDDPSITTNPYYVVTGTTYGQLPVPKAPRAVFLNWVDATSGRIMFPSTRIANGSSIKAKYTEIQVEITIKLGEGQIPGWDGQNPYIVKSGTTYGQLPKPISTRWKYKFDCWTDASGVPYDETARVKNGDTVVARYVQYQSSITLNLNGGTLPGWEGKDVIENYIIPSSTLYSQLPKPKPSQTRLVFDCWTKNGQPVDEQATVQDNDILTAKYTENTISITLYLNGGRIEPYTDGNIYLTVKAGTIVGELPTPVRTGFLFYGWAPNDPYSDILNPNYVLTNNLTLYAGWIQSEFTLWGPDVVTGAFKDNEEFTYTVSWNGLLLLDDDVNVTWSISDITKTNDDVQFWFSNDELAPELYEGSLGLSAVTHLIPNNFAGSLTLNCDVTSKTGAWTGSQRLSKTIQSVYVWDYLENFDDRGVWTYSDVTNDNTDNPAWYAIYLEDLIWNGDTSANPPRVRYYDIQNGSFELVSSNNDNYQTFNRNIVISPKVKSIPNDFLSHAFFFNGNVVIEDGITRIGDNFISNSYRYNNGSGYVSPLDSAFDPSINPLHIPDSVTAICDNFLGEDINFTQLLTCRNLFPIEEDLDLSTLTYIGNGFLYESGVTIVEIPQTVISIGMDFCKNCEFLKQLFWNCDDVYMDMSYGDSLSITTDWFAYPIDHLMFDYSYTETQRIDHYYTYGLSVMNYDSDEYAENVLNLKNLYCPEISRTSGQQIGYYRHYHQS